MFEKIIEKIETVKEKHDYSCDVSGDFVIEGLNKAIDILKEEESKPFTPESFGFKLNHKKSTKYKTCWFTALAGHYVELLSPEINYYQILLDKKVINSDWFKITSNFQAGIIFKALGIID